MKNFIALILSVILLVSSGLISVFAEPLESNDITETVSYNQFGANAVTLTCKYSGDSKNIEISGNVNYNILVEYGKYTLGILRISPQESVENAINAETPDIVAQMNIAAKFSFSISIENTIERFSKYAVILISPEGEISIASEPRCISVTSKYSNSKNYFKGIAPSETAEISISGDMGFGSVIIPVYYDKLINVSKNGYIYPHEDTHCFFDKSYIDDLDSKIRTYSVTGAKVYLQLLLPADSQNTEFIGLGGASADSYNYQMPNVYDEATLSKIYTYVKFLASRYNDRVDGQIGGFIVGNKIDMNRYNACGGLTTENYAERYAFYLSAVANTARVENSEIDVIIPFSNIDSYGNSVEPQDGDFLPTELLNNICSKLDESFPEGFNFNIMVESNSSPITVSKSETSSKDVYVVSNDAKTAEISVNSLSKLNSFLSQLKRNYRSVPKNYIFYWNIPNKLKGNLLECTYVYSYYTLLTNGNVSSFIISFANSDDGELDSIGKTLNVIDTKNGKAQCDTLLPYFDAKSWSDIIANFNSNTATRIEYLSGNGNISAVSKGKFSYFDFSTGDISGWYGASYGKSLNADYGESGQRVLRQTVSRASGMAHSDLLCIYEYDESLIYTPSLNFKMGITDGEISSGNVYEVTVTIGTGNSAVSKSQIVSSGNIFDMWLDVSDYGKDNKASYIKISTRSITGDSDEYSLWVYDVAGHSKLYDSKALDELISEERRNIRNQSQNADGGNSDSIIYWIVFSIILFAIFIGGILLVLFRRDEFKGQNKNN